MLPALSVTLWTTFGAYLRGIETKAGQVKHGVVDGLEPTYEGLKHELVTMGVYEGAAVWSLPTRD